MMPRPPAAGWHPIAHLYAELMQLEEASFGLRVKLRPTGARDLSSVLSAIGLAAAEGPAEED